MAVLKKNLWIVFLTFIALSPEANAQETSSPTEYQVKAAFLYHFGQFVEWPASTFKDDHTPFTICIVGMDPFGKDLDTILQGKKIKDRPVEIRRFREGNDYRSCHILFIGALKKSGVVSVLQALQQAPVLTVGETPDFINAGGMIQLLIAEEKVRFVINSKPLEPAGLQVSAKLMSLAELHEP